MFSLGLTTFLMFHRRARSSSWETIWGARARILLMHNHRAGIVSAAPNWHRFHSRVISPLGRPCSQTHTQQQHQRYNGKAARVFLENLQEKSVGQRRFLSCPLLRIQSSAGRNICCDIPLIIFRSPQHLSYFWTHTAAVWTEEILLSNGLCKISSRQRRALIS